MTKKQFETQYPDFTGYIFLNAGYFLDAKLKEQLDELKIKYLTLYLDHLDNSILKIIQPNIGPNLVYYKDGEFVKKIESVGRLEKLRDFIESCN